MALFVYVHGAGGRGSDFRLVGDRLEAKGHEWFGVDLPCDEEVGLTAYRDAAVEQIRAHGADRRDDLVIVAQSLGGFTAPLIADRVPTRLLVLLAAMIPRPGESGGEWWGDVGHQQAIEAQQLDDMSEEALFLHDVPAEVLAAEQPPRDQTGAVMADPWPLDRWPDTPTRFIVCEDDRFFPADFLAGTVRDRLGIELERIPGGHCAYWSQPDVLAATLDRMASWPP